jgi:TPP-dependent pyruvate/acetoin dehydrogenase alpha subunit
LFLAGDVSILHPVDLTAAAGVVYAFRFRKEPRVAVSVWRWRDLKGDVWEAMNFAAVEAARRICRQQ